MATIFSKIIKGEIPSYKIAEDENFYAFLDINPVALGHTLVVPKTEVDKFFELDDSYLAKILPFCKKVSLAMEQVIKCDRIGMTVIGLEVPHAHIHLIPISTMGDMSFANAKLKLTNEEFQDIAAKINSKFN